MTDIPQDELNRADKSVISAGNRMQKLVEDGVARSGNSESQSEYESTRVQYRREISPAAADLLEGRSTENTRAYREPNTNVITLLPGFEEFADSSKAFPAYHGLEIGNGGDAALYLVGNHEHGHVIDWIRGENTSDIEGSANDHAEEMRSNASRRMKREEGWD